MVVHILGEPSLIGLNRMKELVKLAEQEKVIIALENVENPIILDYVFENIQSDYLKFCFDSGHENFSKIQRGVLEKYLDKLICFHLHDNDGKSDQHKTFKQAVELEELILKYKEK